MNELDNIFIMEEECRYRYGVRLQEISFMESHDEYLYTEGVLDVIEDFSEKIFKKISELIDVARKKIEEHTVKVNLKDIKKHGGKALRKISKNEYLNVEVGWFDNSIVAARIKDFADLNKTLQEKYRDFCELSSKNLDSYKQAEHELPIDAMVNKYGLMSDSFTHGIEKNLTVRQIFQSGDLNRIPKYYDALDVITSRMKIARDNYMSAYKRNARSIGLTKNKEKITLPYVNSTMTVANLAKAYRDMLSADFRIFSKLIHGITGVIIRSLTNLNSALKEIR